MNHQPYRLRLFLIGLLPGLAVGGALSWFVFSSRALPSTMQPAPQSQASNDSSTAPPEGAQGGDVESMTLSEMSTSLKESPDADFERQYLVYAIQLGNYTTAINRAAKERADRAELQKFATAYSETSDELTKQLFQWQSAWGYTDH